MDRPRMDLGNGAPGRRMAARWIGVGALIALAAALVLPGGPAARGQAPKPVEGVKDLDRFLDELYQYGLKNSMWNVRPGDGRFLQIMVASAGAKRVLELGTANGYSGIWIGRALRETGGKLTTIEISPQKAKEAAANFARAGMAELADIRVGDAARIVPTLSGPFDLVFMDTEKRDYLEQFKLALPLLRPGGVFLAHNVVLMRDSMKDFLKEIETHPELTTAIAQTSDDGFSVSYRKR